MKFLPRSFAALRLCVFALILTGCSMVSGTRRADGTLMVTSWRLLWKSEAIRFSVVSTNFSSTLEIGSSTTDAAAVESVVKGAVEGAMKGVVP